MSDTLDCPRCYGDGQTVTWITDTHFQMQECSACHGRGWITEASSYEAKAAISRCKEAMRAAIEAVEKAVKK